VQQPVKAAKKLSNSKTFCIPLQLFSCEHIFSVFQYIELIKIIRLMCISKAVLCSSEQIKQISNIEKLFVVLAFVGFKMVRESALSLRS